MKNLKLLKNILIPKQIKDSGLKEGEWKIDDNLSKVLFDITQESLVLEVWKEKFLN